jgi:large subunit ribosomal protein L12
VTEEGITAVIKAAGVEVDAVRAKALVSALEGVNIEEAISKAAFAAAPAQAAPAAAAAAPAEAEKPKKEEKAKEKAEESGMEGLSALFG